MSKKTHMVAVVMAVLMICVGNVYAVDDVLPEAAYGMVTGTTDDADYYAATMSAGAEIYILDVRTAAEWTWVGHPGINKSGEGVGLDGKVVNISYLIERHNEKVENERFLIDVRKMFGDNPNVVLITMCRSGKRSLAAAKLLEAEGYNVLNMVTGFQGGSDGNGYRTINGWAMDGLPYVASSTGAYTIDRHGHRYQNME